MTIRIAVAGAGLIGRRHIEEVDVSRSAQLVSIVEPGPVGPELARKYDVARYASLDEMIAPTGRTGSSSPPPTRCTSRGV
ncbi:MAG TPA: Gfo/Idh/MocA family oxidoreductase [Pseudonocardia sp.]|uniref:Gfo/Idh/MocA family oxidoreductase n=1 Tax=Pseudonocardia sp. TaxID=60912 RepID=UPI002C92FD03|nr:Gfo/Idh/MocA family oxidoreductase [Pseudonocardia sp.]HTF48428.1 Gfo/Idh/MocA family oxidoreductase [Pseudonocardia sp.]